MNEKIIEIPIVSPEEVLKELASEKSQKKAVSEEKNSIYDLLEEDIMNSDIPDSEKRKNFPDCFRFEANKSISCWQE